MPDVSPILGLPYLQPAQAQKHVTHNEALRQLDVLVQPVVATRSLTLPPAAPALGERHIVAAGGLGAWAGHDHAIAVAGAAGWSFLPPQPGWAVQVLAEGVAVIFTGTVWAGPAERPLRVAELGIATASDAVNRLAVAAPASLFSHSGGGAGGGHQMKVNKAAPGDTASLLFQSGWSGRAEIGLAGSDDFALKVSPDGTTFHEALRAAAATGHLTALQGLAVQGALTGTAVTQGSTDATAGRLLKTGDFGLGGAQAPVLTDLGLAIAPGLYSFAESTAAGSPGTGSFDCSLLVAGPASPGAGAAFVALRRTATPASQRFWIGARLAATGAIAWTEIRHAANLLGTVSQSGGLPTGAVIERGSTANGSYVRFADGTQICQHSLSYNDISTAFGSVFASASQSWTFPVAFSGTPAVSGHNNGDATWVSRGSSNISSTSASFRAMRHASATAAFSLSVMAVGRWF